MRGRAARYFLHWPERPATTGKSLSTFRGKSIMNHTLRAAALALLATTFGACAHAQEGKTRQQVRAELAEALRTGDIVSGEGGLTLRQQFPAQYPQAPAQMGKSREQVRAELAQAMRSGDMLAGGELGIRRNEGAPGGFPKELMVGAKSRADVKAELAEAIRTGDMISDGEVALPLNQLFPNRYAKAPVADMTASHRDAMGRESMQ
jgi:ribosomal protein L30E